MRILIVAATDAEVPPAARSHADVHVLVTGVGMVATAVRCTRALMQEPFDLAFNVGVCGSFNPAYPPGAVVHVTSDRIAELGAQDGDAFLTIHDLQLLGENEPPFSGGRLINQQPPAIPSLLALPPVSGITVNTAHGEPAAIARAVERFNPDVESMEGAAFMYACLVRGVPFAQVRAVSNVVERRNRAAWKLPEALRGLADATARLLEGV